MRINCLLHDAIEGQMTEVKGVVRRRSSQFFEIEKLKNIFGAKGGS